MEREEAIKIIRDARCTSPLRDAIESLIPELRESEDERIRKVIYKLMLGMRKEIFTTQDEIVTKEKVLAYLEKQKYDRMKPIYDARESFESALEKAWKDYNDSGARTVDGCEDDYVECAHAKGFREGYLFGLEKQKESLHISGTCKENADSFTDACKDVIVAIEKYLDWLTGYPDYAPKGKYSLRDMLYCLSILEKQKEEGGYEAIPVESTLEYKLGFKAGKESEKQKEPENISASTMIPSCWAEEPSLQKEQKPIQPNIKREYIEKRLKGLIDKEGEYCRGAREELAHLYYILGGEPSQYLINNVAKEEQKPVEPSDDELVRHQKELYDFKVFAAKQAREHHISFVHDFEWNNFCAEILSYFNEQKPAEWSEEDEDMFVSVLHFLNTNRINERGKVITWVESLPKRFNLQPKQEWSEEECGRLFDIEHYLDGTLQLNPDRKIACIDFLKSLRPSWKPCEEQIHAIIEALKYLPNNKDEWRVLNTLVDVFRKLM